MPTDLLIRQYNQLIFDCLSIGIMFSTNAMTEDSDIGPIYRSDDTM